jgi:hypothetical protein
MLKPVPEDFLCGFWVETRELVPASGGDEVNGVIAIPMLEAMVDLKMLVRGVRTLSHDLEA